MIELLGTLVAYVLALAVIFSALCRVVGEEDKGNAIITNCLMAFVLCFFIIELFNVDSMQSVGVFQSAIPFVSDVSQAGSLTNLLHSHPGVFALDFVELVVLTLMINWISNLLTFENAGLGGRITSRIVIILIGILAYGFVMDMVRDNIVITWCVYCVECIITGGSILYTPMMILAYVTGLREGNLALAFFLREFPGTAIGRAISTAITTSITFLILLVILETQYGSVCTILDDVMESMVYIGSCVIMLMGIYVMIKSIFPTRKN